MYEITADDISQLNDTDLRTLIALLCEAEVGGQGFSSSCVTSGGDQNATDGGLDLRVTLPSEPQSAAYIPRLQTGFQVKTPDLTPKKIQDELCPNGPLGQSIEALA